MSFTIKVHAGTAANSNELFNKIISAMTTVFGYLHDSPSATGDGWKVTNVDGAGNSYALQSKGSQGLDDMVFNLKFDSGITLEGYQHLSDTEFSSYGITEMPFGKETFQLKMDTLQFWMYGNNDFIHIFYRGYGVSSQAEGITPHIISFGKYIPTYNPSVTHLAPPLTGISIGSDVIIPVNDASIFEPDRYIMISSGLTWEKTLVTEVSYSGNTIKVANVSQDHAIVDDSPIILGEISKPYYVWGNNQKAVLTNDAKVLSRLSGSMLSLDATTASKEGAGTRTPIFTDISKLSNASALDMLNYDRYLFELYLYSDSASEQGFMGKLPYLYSVGSSDTNSEATIINDQYFLYRVFKVYGIDESIAVRESYK